MIPSTKTITAPLTIIASMGVYNISIKAVGGTITVFGAAKFVDGSDPNPVPILIGTGLNVQKTKTSPIDGLTIDPSGFAADIIIFY